MAQSTDIEPSLDGTQGGTIAVAVLISVMSAVILTCLSIIIVLAWRRRRGATNNHSPCQVADPTIQNHKLVKVCDTRVNTLVIEKLKHNEDHRERHLSQLPTSPAEDGLTHDDRDVVSDNPTGLYHIPSVQTVVPGTSSPTPSSYCLPHVDIQNASDHQSPSIPHERLSPITPSPPAIIPDQYTVYAHSPSHYPSSVDKEFVLPSSSSVSLSSVSLASCYSQCGMNPSSQRTAFTAFAAPPRSQELGDGTGSSSKEGLHRGNTQPIGHLLKAGASGPIRDGLIRADTYVAHIERTGSIKSLSKDGQPYGKRYRSKIQRISLGGETVTMIVDRAAEGANPRSQPSNPLPVYWDPNLSAKARYHVTGPHHSPTAKKA